MKQAHAVASATDAQAAPVRIQISHNWPAESTLRIGMLLALAAVAMLFLAFTSAYMVRQGLDPQWQSLRMPQLLPANTVILLLSSVCLELARRAGKSRQWLLATVAGGFVFLAGQLALWRELGASGLVFSANAHASFFYTLTAVHGLHLAGGLLAVAWIAAVENSPRRWVQAVALYWHFMGALWLYLVFLLFGVR